MQKMKEKYFVIGFRKIKTAEEYKNKIVGHNHRNRKYIKSHQNIDWSRTEQNIILQDLKYKNATELIESGNNNLKGKSRKLKKNSAFAFEMIIDCTPRDDWKQQDYIAYLKDAYEYLKERFKGQELISAVIHMDEGKPHLHIVFSYFNTELGKWNQRGLMKEKKTDLNKILDDFEEKVGKKYGFVRGRGKELDKPLKKELAKKVKEVKIKKGFFKAEKKKVIFTKDAVDVIKNLDAKYRKAIYENEHLKEQLIKERKEKEEFQNRLKELEKVVKEKERIERENVMLTKRVKVLEKENKELKEKNIILVNSYKKALEIAGKERQLRLSKKVNEKMLENTIKKIKEDYNLTF